MCSASRHRLPLAASAPHRCRLPACWAAFLLGLLLVAAPSAFAASTPFLVPDGAIPLWSDDFDQPNFTLNKQKWTRQAGKLDWQLQTFTSDTSNLAVARGLLYINAVRSQGSAFTSARIRSRGSWFPGMKLPSGKTLRSVHVQVRAQVPSPGQGLLAACVLEPARQKYGAWPASGEIGVVNALNSMTSVQQGIHFGAPYPGNKNREVWTPQANDQPYSGGFHTFAIDWTADTIMTSMDGSITGKFRSRRRDPTGGWWTSGSSAPQAPFNQPFALSLYVAVGDIWTGPPAANTTFPATLAVDFVRVWGVAA